MPGPAYCEEKYGAEYPNKSWRYDPNAEIPCRYSTPAQEPAPVAEATEQVETVPATISPTQAPVQTPTAVATEPAIPVDDVYPWTISESVDPLTDEKDIFAEVSSSTDRSILGYACFYTNDGARNNGAGLFASDDIWFSSNSKSSAVIEYRLDGGDITDTHWRVVDRELLLPTSKVFNDILQQDASELVVRIHRDPAFDGNEGTTAVFDVSSFSAVYERVYDQC